MSQLEQFIVVNIDRSTKSPTQAGFGTPMIAAQFAPNKTKTLFGRARLYAQLSDLTADGWLTSDPVYLAARAIFSQPNVVERIIVGRIDAADADMGATLTAINNENSDWFAFSVIGNTTLTVTLSTTLTTGNIISTVLNGKALADVPYNTSHAATMTAWKAVIEAAFPGATATITGNSIALAGPGWDFSGTFTVAGGTAVAVTTAWAQGTTKIFGAAAWNATQHRIFAYDTPDTTVAGSGTTDIAAMLKALGYENTMGIVHRDPTHYAALAWLGNCLPYLPGSQTWAYKSLVGVTADGFTPAEENGILAKNCSYYTSTSGISHTFEGKCASGEFVDVMIGQYWLYARIQEAVFAGRVNNRKVRYSDAGLEAEGSLIKGIVSTAESMGILVPGTGYVTVPKAASISTADKAARYAPGFEFGGQLEGAIHKSKIAGHLYL